MISSISYDRILFQCNFTSLIGHDDIHVSESFNEKVIKCISHFRYVMELIGDYTLVKIGMTEKKHEI